MKIGSERRANSVLRPYHTPADLVLHMLNALERLEDSRVEDGRALNQLDHALQTATRAERGSADEEVIVAALCHDLGKLFTWEKHGPLSAEILKPFVRPDVAWAVAVHEDFTPLARATGEIDIKRRRRHRRNRAYPLAAKLADEFDLPSIDPEYPTFPLEHFEPVVRRVFDTPRYGQRLSFKYRLARAVLRTLRPFSGKSAAEFEDSALEKAATLYRNTRKRANASINALKTLSPTRKQ